MISMARTSRDGFEYPARLQLHALEIRDGNWVLLLTSAASSACDLLSIKREEIWLVDVENDHEIFNRYCAAFPFD